MIRPFLLIILDGWGIAPAGATNPLSQTKTPTLDYLFKNYPHTQLKAHGQFVGLPKDQVGNSEAGHMNIGAGRIVIQDSVYISDSIKNGTFFKNPAFLEALQHLRQYRSRLHLIGILSNEQCPHMSPEHLTALFQLIKQHNLKEVILHFFADGRDSPPKSILSSWKKIEADCPPNVKIGSITGRLYLDRKKCWERTEKLYNLLTLGQADWQSLSFNDAILNAYRRGETDEFISPTMIQNNFQPIEDGDSIIFYNLRSDRARQLAKPFVQADFELANEKAFIRKKRLANIKFVAMTDFGPDLGDVLTAYPSRDIKNTLPTVLRHLRQLYIAETEKYAHLTYFFNGGYEQPIAEEHRILIRSPQVDSYVKTPAMAAKEITQVAVASLENNFYDFIVVNFSNFDMIGHTGNLKAAMAAIRIINQCLAKLLTIIKKKKGFLIVTADHGNIEIMKDEKTGAFDTMHEKSLAPFILVSPARKKLLLRQEGILGDIAPTILDLLAIKKPAEMTGKSLIVNL